MCYMQPYTNGAYDVLSVGYGINNKCWTRVEVSGSIKNISLQVRRVDYGRKKFYNTGPEVIPFV